MIYFDNAATGGFKPRAVTDAADTVLRYLSANPGRSGHRLSLAGAKMVNSTRDSVAKLFNANPDRVIFTKNCTEALNFAIFGSLVQGGHVIATAFEHNSVLRPLYALESKNLISLDIVYPDDKKSIPRLIREKIKDNTYLIAMTALSNVTGEVLPVEEVGLIAKEKDIYFLVDGAQGGGHTFLDMKKHNISYLALAGHKGLYGIMGSGALILSDECDLEPIIYGGTGSETFNLNQPQIYPERLESGTLNLPAISALGEGVRYITNNFSNFSEHLLTVSAHLIDGLKKIDKIKCFSKPNPAGIISFLHDSIPSFEFADILNKQYDVAVRGGFHCAPLAHKHLKTEQTGLVRASLSVQNSSREITHFLSAVSKISEEYSRLKSF